MQLRQTLQDYFCLLAFGCTVMAPEVLALLFLFFLFFLVFLPMLYLWEIEEKDKVFAIDYRINNILLKFLIIFCQCAY